MCNPSEILYSLKVLWVNWACRETIRSLFKHFATVNFWSSSQPSLRKHLLDTYKFTVSHSAVHRNGVSELLIGKLYSDSTYYKTNLSGAHFLFLLPSTNSIHFAGQTSKQIWNGKQNCDDYNKHGNGGGGLMMWTGLVVFFQRTEFIFSLLIL